MATAYTYKVNLQPLENIYSIVIKEELNKAIKEILSSGRFKFWYDSTMRVEEYGNGVGEAGFDVSTSNARAFVMEYGSGQYIDPMNPDLENYISSKYWNHPYRTSRAIMGRKKGVSYPSFNWGTGLPETKVGKGGEYVRADFQGERERPQIDNMLKAIDVQFRNNLRSEGDAKVEQLVKQGFGSIFSQEVTNY